MWLCCSVAKLCLTLCNPMDCSTPGFPVLHRLPEFAQVHVHVVTELSFHGLAPVLIQDKERLLSKSRFKETVWEKVSLCLCLYPPQLAYPTYWLYLSSDELYSLWLFLMDSSPAFRNSQTKTFHMTNLKTFDWGLSNLPWTPCLHDPFLWNRASLYSGPLPGTAAIWLAPHPFGALA